MRVVSRAMLRDFWEDGHRDAEQPLKAWFAEAKKSAWTSMAEIKRTYSSAIVLEAERVVFNIGGNKYRLIVKVWFSGKAVWIKFVGTHRQYDKLDAKKLRRHSVDIHPIRTDRDHARALRQLETLWGARAASPEANTLEVLVTLVDAYEAKHHVIDAPEPIEAIRFRMEQEGLTRADLEKLIGSRARVSEVLNGRRPLTLAMIRRLRDALGISADVLIGEAPAAR